MVEPMIISIIALQVTSLAVQVFKEIKKSSCKCGGCFESNLENKETKALKSERVSKKTEITRNV
jgi:hypothetical protein